MLGSRRKFPSSAEVPTAKDLNKAKELVDKLSNSNAFHAPWEFSDQGCNCGTLSNIIPEYVEFDEGHANGEVEWEEDVALQYFAEDHPQDEEADV